MTTTQVLGTHFTDALLTDEELREGRRRLDGAAVAPPSEGVWAFLGAADAEWGLLRQGQDEAGEARLVARVAARLHPGALGWLAVQALDEPDRRRRALLEAGYARCAGLLALRRWRG